ncbi:MAG: hypothetical protein ACHQ1G_07615 [Planctomycetota bacterium]
MGKHYCVICGEPCAEPEPGQPELCEEEDCRAEAWKQMHPEDSYLAQDYDEDR